MRSYFQLLALIVFVCIHLSGYSQSNASKRISGTKFDSLKNKLESEFQVNSVEDDRQTRYVYSKVQIPDWAISPFYKEGNKLFVLGVSDPYFSKEKAFDQAFLRAKTILSFMIDMHIVNLSDCFITEKKTSKKGLNYKLFQEMITYESVVTLDSAKIEIEKKSLNTNGEALVLISYQFSENDPKKCPDHMMVYAELYAANKKGRGVGLHDTYRFEILTGSQKNNIKSSAYLSYLVLQKDKSCKIESVYNGYKFYEKDYTLSYKSNTPDLPPNRKGVSLNKGLWNAYLISVFNGISLQLNGETSLKKLSDQTEKNSNEIIRLKTENDLKLENATYHIYQNKLYLDLKIEKI